MDEESKFPTEEDIYRFAFWEGVYCREETDKRTRIRDRHLDASKERWEEYKEEEIKRRNKVSK